MSRKKDTGKLPNFADFGREYFHLCSSPGQKLGCYGVGLTSATIVVHLLRVYVEYPNHFLVQTLFLQIFEDIYGYTAVD
jgi:hypothetical protein